MFEPPPSSVSVEKKGNLYYVIVYEGGKRTEYGPFNEQAASANAAAEKRRLGLARFL